MTRRKDLKRYEAEWVTVSIVALPLGWQNVYHRPDGTKYGAPCPGMLLQELHRISVYSESQDGSVRLHETLEKIPPYRTRVVFGDCDEAFVDVAFLIENYIATIGPGESLEDV